ncbi:MAG: Trk system potassium transporter TrkA [Oscillospiraceae bacterium]|nr:Trk system potassium transporter TrkA [Oscillospiraceae bacterium]
MNIIIIGCGKVGEALAEQLNEQGNNITVIDTDAKKLNDVSSKWDVMCVTGNGATHLVQQEAGIERADLMIAVTGSDELNLLCCLIARKAGNNCKTIARVRSPQYSSEAPFLKDELGLAMVINPEQAAAEEIARVLRFPSAINIDTFCRGRVELIKLKVPEGSPLVGVAVKDLSKELDCDVLVCTLERGDEAYIVNGNTVFEERDVISIIASPKKVNDFFRKINYKSKSVKDAMIVGGGEIGHYLCDILVDDGVSVKIIEKDPQRSDELCALWGSSVTVINGDASDQEVLLEEGLAQTGAFVALTNLDEENILLSLFAHSTGSAKLVTKINRIDFENVIKQLDLDTIIYPKNITSDLIVRYVRAIKNAQGSNVEQLHQVIKGKIEAAEFIIREQSAVTGTPLMNLKLREGVLVAAILRGKKVVIPRGSDTIEPDDTVVIVSGSAELHDIMDILK